MDSYVKQTMWDLRKQRDRVQSILDSMTALFGEPGPEGVLVSEEPNVVDVPRRTGKIKAKGVRRPYKKREKSPEPEIAREDQPPARAGQRKVSDGKITMSSAIRAVVSGFQTGLEFSRDVLKATILARWPELAPKINSMSVYLIDFVERGELKRKGSGADALFTMGKLKEAREVNQPMMRRPAKAPSEREQAWRNIRGEDVQVPRDADAGNDG